MYNFCTTMSRNTYSSALTPTNMHFYFFKSTCEKDCVSKLTIFTNSSAKAFALARRYFAKYNCKGEPAMLAI